MKRSELPDSVFGIPEERKYPMPDKRHTLSAIKLFGHVEPKYEEELAKNIIKNMKKYNIPESAVGKDNKLRKYIDKYYNESTEMVEEKYIMNEDDIYYNKDKFDSGLTNLCFITGHGGSGKSTMGEYMAKDKNTEHVEMDDVIWCWRYINKPFEPGSMLESFFTTGPGKKYFGTSKQEMRNIFPNYDEDIIREFMDFAYKFAKTHKNKKYAIEGVQLFLYINPEELTDYAVYIKGTSACVSIFRAVKRDYQKYKDATTSEKIRKSIDRVIIKLSNVKETERAIEKYRKYFSSLIQTNESTIIQEESVDDTLEKIKVFNKELAQYGYIVVSKDGAIIDQIKQNSFKDYLTLSPNQFKKYKGGICWDYVAYEYPYFKSHFSNAKIKSFFFAIVKNNMITDTHTFLLFYMNDKVYWFEDSWKPHCGIYEYNNEDEAISKVTDILRGSSKDDWFIVEYNAGDKKFIGIPEREYISIMAKLPEHKFKYIKDAKSKTIQKAKLDKNGKIINESVEDEYERVEVPLTEEVLIEAANNAARYTKWCKMESFPFCSVHEMPSCVVSVKNASFAFATFDGSEDDLNYIINSCNENNIFRYGTYEVSCIPNSQGTKYLCGKITELYDYVKKSTLTEEARLDNAPSNMYHLSTENHDGDIFEPRYYDNDNVKAGTERRVKRICFSDSINGCIYSIFPSGAYDVDLYVHVPGSEVTKVYETTPDDIYDSNITHELWVKEPVTMKCIGKIHISGVYKDKVKVLEADKDKTGYGKRKYYEPRWNWVEKINEATTVKSEYNMKSLKEDQMKEYYKWFKVVFNGTKDSITEKETKSTKVIYYNNEIIGYVAFSRYQDGNEKYLGLGNFMIIPKYQRSGHGANVVKYIVDKYKDTYDLIYCWVDRSNTNAVNFYKKIAKVNTNTQSNPDQYYVEFYRKGKKSMNEFSVGAGPVVGIGSNPEPIYIINYMQNNVFSGATQERFGICKAGMKDLHTFGGKYNRLHYTNLEDFEKEASNIKVYRYTGPLSDKYPSIYSIIEDADTDLDFYRLLTGNEIDNRSSIKNDPYFQREAYINDELSAITECVVAGVKELDNKYEIPMIGLNEDGRIYNYYRDLDGVYIKNEVTNMRSGSYDDISDIPEEVNNLVIKGVY